MTTLLIVGLVWFGCAAVVVLALCAAAHKAAPELKTDQEINGQSANESSRVGTDFLRKAA